MKRASKFFARLYPSSWRKRYGDEFDALLEDSTSTGHDAVDVFKGAMKMQMTSGGFVKPLLVCAVLGVLAAVAISFAWPDRYLSEGLIKVVPEQLPEGGAITATNQLIWDGVQSMTHEIVSPLVLTEIIQRYGLYPRELARMPFDDVVNNMRKHLFIAPLVRRNQRIPAFAIQFDYPDAHVAQQVTAALMSRFIEMSVLQNARSAYTGKAHPGSGMLLEPLDTPSLPTQPSRVNRMRAAAVGLFSGLLAGLTIAIVKRSRRGVAA